MFGFMSREVGTKVRVLVYSHTGMSPGRHTGCAPPVDQTKGRTHILVFRCSAVLQPSRQRPKVNKFGPLRLGDVLKRAEDFKH
jgi:hypothetical protein